MSERLDSIKLSKRSQETEPAFREIVAGLREHVEEVFADPTALKLNCCFEGCCVSVCCVQLS